MKNFINSFYIVSIIIFVSCKNIQNPRIIDKNQYQKEKSVVFKQINCRNSSYIDDELDSTFYKLDICSDDDYLIDEYYRETILLTRKVFVGDSCFGGYANIPKALIYSKKNNKQAECYTRISINIENKEKKFDEVWFWKQEMYNGELAGKIALDEGHFKYKNQNELGIKISYNYGFPDYYKQNTLNFIKKKKKWKIISRESFNTSKAREEKYIIETGNLRGHYEGELSDTFPPAEKIEITNEMILFN